MPVWPKWLEVAQEDLDSARYLIEGGIARTAAFHLQQAAEKTMKAVLLAEGIDFPRTSHALTALLQLFPEGHAFRLDFRKFDAFEGYATSFRYPTPTGRIKAVENNHDLPAALRDLTVLIAEVRDYCAEIDPA